jgi:hypothetical protein
VQEVEVDGEGGVGERVQGSAEDRVKVGEEGLGRRGGVVREVGAGANRARRGAGRRMQIRGKGEVPGEGGGPG